MSKLRNTTTAKKTRRIEPGAETMAKINRMAKLFAGTLKLFSEMPRLKIATIRQNESANV
jgi:hypothetical protein